MAQGKVMRSSLGDGLFWVFMCSILAGALGLGMAFAVAEINGSGWVMGGAIGALAFVIGAFLLARNAATDLPPPNTIKAPVAPPGGAFQAPRGGAFRAPGAPDAPSRPSPSAAGPAPVAAFADLGQAAGDGLGKAAFTASAAVTSAAQAARDAIAGVVDPGPSDVSRPAALAGPRDGGPDDLKRIKGVGPKLEELLHSLGFYHFDQIAAWGPSEVAWVDSNLEGFSGRATRDEWVAQAKLLAAGGETEFSKRVDKGEVY